MTGVETVTYATQAIFFAVALYIAWYTYSRPTKSNIHIFIFFALLALTVAYTWVYRFVELAPGEISDVVPILLLLTLPYVLVRLARDYASVPHSVMRVCEMALIGSYILAIYPGAQNYLVLTVLVGYFAALSIYAAVRFYHGARVANGITQKRLRALGWASFLLGAGLFTVSITAVADGTADTVFTLLRQVALVASAGLYVAGFAPPLTLRQAWQAPELRQFLRDTLHLSRWKSMDELLDHLQFATAQTVGAPNATIGLWNPESELIEFRKYKFAPGETIGGRAFQEQRTILSLDTVVDDPESRDLYERANAYAVIAAPISTMEEKIGVIALYSPNPPIFAEEDIALLDLLADQIAVVLENRKHLQAHAALQAREESTRLKDEFLSVAAHDLKTPLTTILGTGQYLERRLSKLGEDSVEYKSVQRLNRESTRLRTLVQGLLDASRIERGQLLTNIEPADLVDLIHDVVERSEAGSSHVVHVELPDSLNCTVDPVRIQQVLENLLENARKYSTEGTAIRIGAWQDGDDIHLFVSDEGIGIDADEQEQIFERFYRSTRFGNGAAPGIGLGLYICKQIIEQHGGEISVESNDGPGSTFRIILKRVARTVGSNVPVDSRSR